MSLFSFEGRLERTGEVVHGVREAQSHTVLGQDLLSEGILLTRYARKAQAGSGLPLLALLFRRVPVIERAMFARYFSLMLRAGMDVKNALHVLTAQTNNKTLKEAIESVYQDIERGKTLAESMKAFPNAFPLIFTSFVEVGETTGRLQESLNVLAVQLQKEYELKRAVKGGLLYPAVILTVLLAVLVAMMFFVVPKLVEVFTGFNVPLPLATRILIWSSNFFQAFWWLLFIGVALLLLGGWMLLQIKSVKYRVVQALLFMPAVGPIMQKVNLARFCRNLSSLLQSGVPFIRALEILSESTPNPIYASKFFAARDHVKQGKELSAYLSSLPRLFPPVVVNIVKVGEETGALDQVLMETATFYEGEVDQTMHNITSVMEPVLMVLVGLAVAALAISVISPIYDLVNVI